MENPVNTSTRWQKIYNLTAPNLLPYFNGEGRYLHALIAVGHQKVGHKSFYASMTEELPPSPSIQSHSLGTISKDIDMDCDQDDHNCNTTHDSGGENLDILYYLASWKSKMD